jgi:hypothetical protein
MPSECGRPLCISAPRKREAIQENRKLRLAVNPGFGKNMFEVCTDRFARSTRLRRDLGQIAPLGDGTSVGLADSGQAVSRRGKHAGTGIQSC